ncbi:MAG: hypothetical protein U0R80_02070 [Nocardioidaceae bacterium]|mgnify:CR=1 FL=1
MLAAPKFGFVFLASPKAGSTAIQRAFAEHAQLLTPGPPSLKHVTASEFEADFAPLLAKHGYERSSYLTTCLVREPIDLTLSWYRYRSRRNIAGSPHFTGDIGFDEFAERVVSGRGAFRRPRDFLCDADGRMLVERPYRYEHVDACVAWMSEQVGEPVSLRRVNVSPPREVTVSATTRQLLEDYYSVDLELWESAL